MRRTNVERVVYHAAVNCGMFDGIAPRDPIVDRYVCWAEDNFTDEDLDKFELELSKMTDEQLEIITSGDQDGELHVSVTDELQGFVDEIIERMWDGP